MTIKAEVLSGENMFYIQGKEPSHEIVAAEETEGSLGNYEFRILPAVGLEEVSGGHVSFTSNRLIKGELSGYMRGDIAGITVYPTRYETVLELKPEGTVFIALNEGLGRANNVQLTHKNE